MKGVWFDFVGTDTETGEEVGIKVVRPLGRCLRYWDWDGPALESD